jgi:pyruvate carboxylase
MSIRPIKKLLVANRSEIATRVFRSATELRIRTVAIYSFEDRYALHRFKADEAYQIGKPGEPIRAYLDINAIVALAVEKGVDAIHPGYGFLSENPDFAQACRDAGIIFVGPSTEALHKLGDKTAAKHIADAAGVPILGGTKDPLSSVKEGIDKAAELGYPIILKAAKGGGGRGMRVVTRKEDFAEAFETAQREAQSAFGSPDTFIEKFIEKARHIEVQLLGDQHGRLVHLYERDCSVQRRHQKVVEIAPAPNLDPGLREDICNAALKIGQQVGYYAAGTVEFLVDALTNKFYFIEVNPRIQVEHTVTEETTGVDLVTSQILVAQGVGLDDPRIDLSEQSKVTSRGFAVQCRVTTEDPANNFMPDYGRVTHYRSASGMGIRLDAGSAFSGAVINPYYDSLLVKVTARGRTFNDAVRKMERTLAEFRVRGVKTNIPFLMKLIAHPVFLDGNCTTRFIEQTPELFHFKPRQNRAQKLLTYIGETIVNGNPEVKNAAIATRREPAAVPAFNKNAAIPDGYRQIYLREGAKVLADHVLKEKKLLVTDTTFRDAHQSLLATRLRTVDMLNIADVYARHCSEMFSLEMWGGATFDTSMRFMKECPWQRLSDMRERVPNILFQMLLRASNAVGYTNYPDNIVIEFVKESVQAGMDVFRVFDALNWVTNMQVAMNAVLEAGGICEAAICYTGDILNPKRTKYNLAYYVDLAKDLEKRGAHFLAIKDMAGLCKPAAARLLVKTLKEEVGIPIHFHTHDTAGIQAASILNAAEVGLDIVDVAIASMSGGTSQPNLNTVTEALNFTDRAPGLDNAKLDEISTYWLGVREFYKAFESEVLPATSDLYIHEMPGGQYTNLYQQARSLGLADRWAEICKTYAEVNLLFGDIVKVTPTSKAVGDMALFMVSGNLTIDQVLDPDRELAFPASVVDLLGGMMGQPPGGFPENVKRKVLRGESGLTQRPGESLPPADFEKAEAHLLDLLERKPTKRDVLSYLLYPRVFEDYAKFQKKYSDVSGLPSPVFFYGLQPGEEFSVDIEEGKTLITKYLTMSEPYADGRRTLYFELNGQPRDVTVLDQAQGVTQKEAPKADSENPKHVGAGMPGMVVAVAVKVGQTVAKGEKLLSLEAMKMESTVYAQADGVIEEILVKPGTQIQSGDLLIRFA